MRRPAYRRSSPPRAPRPQPASATQPSTWNDTSAAPATSRCRCWATASAPSPWASASARSSGDARRADLLKIARKATESINYRTVGTLEFLLDEDKNFYFMEMNTRIQVEHTVTEEVFGIDLVREQIRLAAGDPLRFPPDMRPRGHAIELRINAEDPVTFAPSPGRITALNLPGGLGVRVDTHIYQQYVVPSHYDSLLAKLIVHAENRPAALARLRRV